MEHRKWRVSDTVVTHNHPTRFCETYILGPQGMVARTAGATSAEAQELARLIAAAPEQNALLAQALALIERCADYQSPNPESERPSWRTVGRMAEEWIEQTREILARARAASAPKVAA